MWRTEGDGRRDGEKFRSRVYRKSPQRGVGERVRESWESEREMWEFELEIGLVQLVNWWIGFRPVWFSYLLYHKGIENND